MGGGRVVDCEMVVDEVAAEKGEDWLSPRL